MSEHECESEGFRQEAERIAFRRQLMGVPGGATWLAHVARLFECREGVLGPTGFGMPAEVAAAMRARASQTHVARNWGSTLALNAVCLMVWWCL